MDKQNTIRLQKYMALSGVASRRKSEEIILQGRVKVNSQTIRTLGVKVNQQKDKIEVDGKEIKQKQKKIYIMLNKPVAVVSTVNDQFNRETVIDLIKNEIKERIYPVGRLDYDTEGLILLTNDGEFTNGITHPKHHIDKTYIAVVKGIPTELEKQRFAKGLKIEDYKTAPAEIEVVKTMDRSSKIKITIHEGKNRQVRKMCEAIGHPVIKLKRVAIGNVHLAHLHSGSWRHLKSEEVKYLLKESRGTF